MATARANLRDVDLEVQKTKIWTIELKFVGFLVKAVVLVGVASQSRNVLRRQRLQRAGPSRDCLDIPLHASSAYMPRAIHLNYPIRHI